jgi:CheY-like chemotaxis protein
MDIQMPEMDGLTAVVKLREERDSLEETSIGDRSKQPTL